MQISLQSYSDHDTKVDKLFTSTVGRLGTVYQFFCSSVDPNFSNPTTNAQLDSVNRKELYVHLTTSKSAMKETTDGYSADVRVISPAVNFDRFFGKEITDVFKMHFTKEFTDRKRFRKP